MGFELLPVPIGHNGDSERIGGELPGRLGPRAATIVSALCAFPPPETLNRPPPAGCVFLSPQRDPGSIVSPSARV